MERRRSDRARLPSLKAELNQLSENKLALFKGVKTKSSSQSDLVCQDVLDRTNDSSDVLDQTNDGRGVLDRTNGSSDVLDQTNDSTIENESEESSKVILDVPVTVSSLSITPQSSNWVHYKWLCEQLPGREIQLQLLLTLFGERKSSVPPSIYIYGNSGVGKTLTIQALLSCLKVPYVIVNCTECYCSRLLYETILNRLARFSLTSQSGYSGITRCVTMVTFIQQLQQLIDTSSSQTIYIVLDHCDRLRELESTLFPALLTLAPLCSRNVCVILISHLAYETMFSDFSPLPIFFPDYTKSQVLAILALDCPAHQSLPFFKTFVNHIWNVFSHVCKDLSELRYLSSLLFGKYVEPVELGEIGSHETRRLWHHIQPFFKDVISHVYLRELSSRQWMKISTNDSEMNVSSEVRGHLELPHCSKYLLLAAYLASYNPTNTDQRFFSKRSSTSRKSHRHSQKQKVNYQLLGPKMFPLDRLMAIFYSIIDEPVSPTIDVYSQVSSLVTLQLLCQTTSLDVLDIPKFKCLVSLDFIRRISRSVDFDIMHYLYDFN